MNNFRKPFSTSAVTLFLFLIGILLFPQGCSHASHAVIASTGTVIGVELSQNPATQAPQGKLGYNRAEFAYVPTNRSKKDDAGNIKNGAADTAEVIMELKYSDIFSSGSGIYQRLAIGKEAVRQPGASFMFAKDAKGEMSDATARALGNIQSFKGKSENVDAELAKLGRCYLIPENQGPIDNAIKSQGIDIDNYSGLATKHDLDLPTIRGINNKVKEICNFS